MGTTLTQDELDWLQRLDDLLRTGLTRAEAAKQLGVTDATVGNRLRALGLRIVWLPRLGGANDGATLASLLATGYLEVNARHGAPSRGWRPRGRPNTTGAAGIAQPGKGGGYRATLTVRGKQIHLGRFDTVEEAAAARAVALEALE